jgi:hypothetical protein
MPFFVRGNSKNHPFFVGAVQVVTMQGSAIGVNQPFFNSIGMAVIFESNNVNSSEVGTYNVNLHGGPALTVGQNYFAGVTAGTLFGLQIGSGGNKRGQKWRFDGGQWRNQRGQSDRVFNAGRSFA